MSRENGVFTKEILLERLLEVSNQIGYIPGVNYLKNHSLPSSVTFGNYFGKYSNAVAELQKIVPHLELQKRKPKKLWDRASLLVVLSKKINELDEVPSIADLLRLGLPDPATFTRHFGNYDNALKELDVLEQRKRKKADYASFERICEVCKTPFKPRSPRQVHCWKHCLFNCACGKKYHPKRFDQVYCSNSCRELFKKRKLRAKRSLAGLCPQCGHEMLQNGKTRHCVQCKKYFSENHKRRLISGIADGTMNIETSDTADEER